MGYEMFTTENSSQIFASYSIVQLSLQAEYASTGFHSNYLGSIGSNHI